MNQPLNTRETDSLESSTVSLRDLVLELFGNQPHLAASKKTLRYAARCVFTLKHRK